MTQRSKPSILCFVGGLGLVLSVALSAQQPRPPAIPPGFAPIVMPAPQPVAPANQPPAQPTATPVPAAPAPAGQTAPANQAPAANPPAITAPAGAVGPLNLQNASLTEVIDMLTRELHINYILDPRVPRAGVTLNTYGETREIDKRSLLDTILRINNAAMVQVGNVYRIVPLAQVPQLPLQPQVDRKQIPADDRTELNLVFLKYASVADLTELLKDFVGEGARVWSYPPANLLLVLDSNRNMRRTMELISLFDNDTLASQRVRSFEVKYGRPQDLAKELETIFKSISLNEKVTPIRFLPLDRINTLIAVTANPSAFGEVEKWLRKLDQPTQASTGGTVQNAVYRVRYARSDVLGNAISQLYGSFYPMMGIGCNQNGPAPLPGTIATGGGGGYGGGGYGSGAYGGGGYGGAYGGGFGAGTYAPAMGIYGAGPGYGPGGYPPGAGYGYPSGAYPGAAPLSTGATAAGSPMGATSAGTARTAPDGTGTYLSGQSANGQPFAMPPRIIPNCLDNTVLVQGTAQETASILKLLRDIDLAPRQVLIDAKIYEVKLTGNFFNGVRAYLQQRGAGEKDSNGNAQGGTSLPTRKLAGGFDYGNFALTAGALVGSTRELLAFLQSSESQSRTKVISAPSVVATDGIAASVNVGSDVPTLSAQAVTGAQSGGTSLFANSIQNRSSGVTLNIKARVNPSGVVTLEVNQEVSSPEPPALSAAIQSPSFSKRTVSTQVTVQDGDTVALAGIILESNTSSTGGIPGLNRIPLLGFAFGGKSFARERTELIIFMTPRVIYDTNEVVDATEELKSNLRRLQKIMRD